MVSWIAWWKGICLDTMLFRLLLVLTAAVISSSAADCNDTQPKCPLRRVCYYGSWAVYRWGNGKFDVEDIDPFLCTHIVYGFVGINEDGTVRIMDPWNEIDKAALQRFSDLKKKNPALKTLIACGGWNEGSVKFSKVASSPQLREKFAKSALNLTLTYNYDGFDLDWEYPNQRGGVPDDVKNFVELLKVFRKEFDPYKLLVTAAVAACEASASLSYDVPNVSELLHFINVMTYDIHGAWNQITGHNSPLYASSFYTTAADRALTTDACLNWWLNQGADPCKVVVGIGLYGRTFTLADQTKNGIGAPAWSGGTPGPYTQESGFLGYNEIIEKFNEGGWTVIWDEEQQVPYAYKGNQWVGYDDERSIRIKAQYVRRNCLGGIITWSVETDDFKGLSGKKNPLLNAIKTNLEDGSDLPELPPTLPPGITEPPAEPPVTDPPQTPPPTETPQDPIDPICTSEGYKRDPVDCSTFYYCRNHEGTYIKSTFNCKKDLYYDPVLGVCNWAYAVQCP